MGRGGGKDVQGILFIFHFLRVALNVREDLGVLVKPSASQGLHPMDTAPLPLSQHFWFTPHGAPPMDQTHRLTINVYIDISSLCLY